ncbi:MAG: ribonuclease Z [Flavobacteriaceae bacterium]|nr:ribonuclease Z [Flavobacteriaceae bacterium]
MNITILGCHSATPRSNFHTTSQLIELKNHMFLIDCGEGTQIRLREEKIKFSRIKNIFISHLHGDHFYGLIGLINTFKLLGRSVDLNIYGPIGIKEVIKLQLKLSNSWTDFRLYFHELNNSKAELVYEDSIVKVKTIPLIHRVYTNGFLFQEKAGLRKIETEKVKLYNVPICDYENLKNGKDFINEKGQTIKNSDLTLPPKKPFSYAFCSDTVFNPQMVNQIKNVDLLYHESTFLNEHKDLATKTLHSTAEQAGKIASLSNVGKLMLGHFSTRYRDKKMFIQEANKQFDNVFLAKEGETYKF